MSWNATVAEREQHLLLWYRKMAEVGHGEITVSFNQDNNKIEIDANFRTRDGEALKIFKAAGQEQ